MTTHYCWLLWLVHYFGQVNNFKVYHCLLNENCHMQWILLQSFIHQITSSASLVISYEMWDFPLYHRQTNTGHMTPLFHSLAHLRMEDTSYVWQCSIHTTFMDRVASKGIFSISSPLLWTVFCLMDSSLGFRVTCNTPCTIPVHFYEHSHLQAAYR